MSSICICMLQVPNLKFNSNIIYMPLKQLEIKRKVQDHINLLKNISLLTFRSMNSIYSHKEAAMQWLNIKQYYPTLILNHETYLLVRLLYGKLIPYCLIITMKFSCSRTINTKIL